MKRSEMIDKLSKLLYYDAVEILNKLEELGMLPPAYVKTIIEGDLYSLQTVNEWESESSEEDSDHVADSSRYSLNGLTTSNIVIDEAKDIGWNDLTRL